MRQALIAVDRERDPERRMDAAIRARDAMFQLDQSPGWELIRAEAEAAIEAHRDQLESGHGNVDEHRGALRVLRWIVGAQQNTIDAAATIIDQQGSI